MKESEQTIVTKKVSSLYRKVVRTNASPWWLENPETKKRLELDIYLPKDKIAIEVNGLYHYMQTNYKEKVEDVINRDKIKAKLCADNGVKLFHLFVDDDKYTFDRSVFDNVDYKTYLDFDSMWEDIIPFIQQDEEKENKPKYVEEDPNDGKKWDDKMEGTIRFWVTPSIAKDILAKSAKFKNRKINRQNVENIKKAMKNGDYDDWSVMLSFNEDDYLHNGYHTTTALSELPEMDKDGKLTKFGFILNFKVANAAFMGYDTGKKRNFSDFLEIAGCENSAKVNGIMSRYCTMVDGFVAMETNKFSKLTWSGTKGVTIKEKMRIYKAKQSVFEDAVKFTKTAPKKGKTMQDAMLGGYIVYLVLNRGYSMSDIEDFFEQLCSKNPENGPICEDKSIEWLRKTLIEDRDSYSPMSSGARDFFVKKVFNNYMEGDRDTILTMQDYYDYKNKEKTKVYDFVMKKNEDNDDNSNVRVVVSHTSNQSVAKTW